MTDARLHDIRHQEVQIPVDGTTIEAELTLPRSAAGIVLFAHGSGSGRHNPRNQFIAWNLHRAGLGTLMVDLLTRQEEVDDTFDGHLRHDARKLAHRLIAATIWTATHDSTRNLDMGYFGASTGAAAALIAAARLGRVISAVVSCVGRPDLASKELPRVVSPALFIVGGRDERVLEMHHRACALLAGEKRLQIEPHATHLFEEPWALNPVAALTSEWFRRHLTRSRSVDNPAVADSTSRGSRL